MDDLSQRIANLSPQKRALLDLRLMNRSVPVTNEQAISRRGVAGPCPLSFAQERLWFLNQLEPDSPAYNVHRAVRMRGALNMEALQKTLDAIVARHEVLRTTFAVIDGSPVQLIAQNPSVELPVIDLSDWPEAEREAEVRRLLLEKSQHPFDLAHDLMLRAAVLRLAEGEHVLLLTMHHIASDAWSMGILMREMAAFYEAFSSGQPAPLPELPIQYADFALWQRRWLQGEVFEAQLSYWKQRLQGSLPVLELPADHPRPAIQTYRGARQPFELPLILSERLKSLSRQEGVTLFMTLLAAFQTLLHRYTGLDDILVGSPIAGRARGETESLIGFFVNSLVLRTDFQGNPTFRELLGRVREVALGAYAHQELPFEKLVEELQPERRLSHSPLFQVMFAFQNVPRHSLELQGLNLQVLEVDNRTAKFDATLYMYDTSERLQGSLEYNTDLFDAASIARMLGHFQTLLEGIVADPDERLSYLPLLTGAERQQALVKWNDTQADYPRHACLHELFESQAERTPDAVAVTFDGRQLTYRQLNRRANRLAHHLKKVGVGPDVPVGICVDRSLEMVVGLLGILKAGGVYVPLDPAYPPERLAFMLEDARIPVLATQQRWVAGLPAHSAQVVCLDTDWGRIARESPENPRSGATANNLAYVIYTSGSTGKPKGVQVVHRGVVNFLESMRQQPGLTARDTLLAVTTLSFDIAGLELYLPLSVGARVVLIGREAAMDGRQLALQLARSGATAMQATPATWRLLLDAGWSGNPPLKILCGGEALPRELAEQLRQRGASLWNLYGPTETTIWSTRYAVTGEERTIPIGRPITNTQVYVLDPRHQPLPIGVPGELYIGGHGVARGYLYRPELTAETFVPHPFSPEPGARLYRTGDLVRYRPDGTLEFLGRLDHQVKIRGSRVELGEIEACLRQHPAVRDGVVLAREDAPGETRLVAYLVAKQPPAPTPRELRSFLQEKLPDYMLPSAFVFLDALPLTPSGKVDRRALPAPDSIRPELEVTYVAPRSPTEEVVAGIWADILSLEQVGVQDNFFELGGHSLLATQVVSRLYDAFQVAIPLRQFFEEPTVAGLSAAILRNPGDRARIEKRAALLLRLAHLSEDEAETMLVEKISARKEREAK